MSTAMIAAMSTPTNMLRVVTMATATTTATPAGAESSGQS